MCGISGIINTTKNKVNKEEIQNINDLISHRGPDDEGFYFEKNFAFGHRRLSVLDLSSDGHQPMHYLDKYTITYNGEVYNYLEIRDELINEGYVFKSSTDTEVILASYDKWGEECVNRFNGMWAFAIYDKQKDIIFCSRDRFGIKPFYYTQIDDRFVFGSEIKQLLEFYQDRYVNEKILMDYLVIGYEEHTNETFFKNIYKLEQSHNLVYNLKTNRYTISKYYDINRYEIDKDENSSILAYKQNLDNSIKLRLRSDVKVGTCLSGGIDSSSIAAIASKIYKKKSNQRFTAIHAKSIQKNNDESLFAKNVADYCDLDLSIIEPSSVEFIGSIDEVIYAQEEPFGSPSIFMQYFVMKKAKELGCKVMLDGQGGDETLLGYERYYPAYLASLSVLDFFKSFIKIVRNSKLSFFRLLAYVVYFMNTKIRFLRLKKKFHFLIDSSFNQISLNMMKENSKLYLDIAKLQYQEIYKTQLPHLLKYEDKNSMRHSIECRLPFLDINTLEEALFMPNKYKIKDGWTKYVLRKIVDRLLPKNVVWRTDKFGFESPINVWLNLIKQDDFDKLINDSDIYKMLFKKRILLDEVDSVLKWKIFNILKWERMFNVSIVNFENNKEKKYEKSVLNCF